MSRDPALDDVWQMMSALVLENKDVWRRSAVERVGLPFSRIRILRRLDRQPMTMKQVAESATIDAPAATVAVNDLEANGLVVRTVDPGNRRCKVVSLTDAGRDVLDDLAALDDPPPAALGALSAADLDALHAILAKLRRD
jgi:DNA-binding MarR family transcriptional regulator